MSCATCTRHKAPGTGPAYRILGSTWPPYSFLLWRAPGTRHRSRLPNFGVDMASVFISLMEGTRHRSLLPNLGVNMASVLISLMEGTRHPAPVPPANFPVSTSTYYFYQYPPGPHRVNTKTAEYRAPGCPRSARWYGSKARDAPDSILKVPRSNLAFFDTLWEGVGGG